MVDTAGCMRRQGGTDFPDPTTPPSSLASYSSVEEAGGLVLTIPDAINKGPPALQQAAAAWRFKRLTAGTKRSYAGAPATSEGGPAESGALERRRASALAALVPLSPALASALDRVHPGRVANVRRAVY
jgi:hypothetical protein